MPCQVSVQSVVSELVAARAGVGGARLHLNVDRGVLANRQADSRARFIGEPLFCGSNLEAPRRQAGRLIVPPAVGCDRARFTCVDVPDCHRDFGKGCAGLVRHHAGKARSRLGPPPGTPPSQATKAARRIGPGALKRSISSRSGEDHESGRVFHDGLTSFHDIRLDEAGAQAPASLGK